jgi:hypothetical protein
MNDAALVVCDICRMADFVPPEDRVAWEKEHRHDGMEDED